MQALTKRFLLFLLGCIPLRFLLTYTASFIPRVPNVKYMGIPAAMIGVSFFYLFFSGSRKTGPEVFGGKIWWNNLRVVHGFLFIMFAIHALMEWKYSWIFLFSDTMIGLIAFFIYHFF